MVDERLIRLMVGFDQREAVAFHTFVQSVLDVTTLPVSITPLVLSALPSYRESHTDGSNTFVYSRFLTPYLAGFDGWAIFTDGDMICQTDLAQLWALRSHDHAVMVVKHDYETKATRKYLGNKNENYPRKNWSSLILWNCSHPKNRILSPDFVMDKAGAFLHRFSWLEEEEIGALPKEWNWLTTEYEDNPEAHLLHFTLGTPCFRNYQSAPMADAWHRAHDRSKQGIDA
jgi:lipopolysaccharide biosynthesis glycosyltransferase